MAIALLNQREAILPKRRRLREILFNSLTNNEH